MVRMPLPQLLAMYLELKSMLLALLDPPLLDQRRVWRIILNQRCHVQYLMSTSIHKTCVDVHNL